MREWKVALPKAWSPETHAQFPLGFRQGVQALLVRSRPPGELALLPLFRLVPLDRAASTRSDLPDPPSLPQMAMTTDTQAPIGALGRLDWASRAGIAERVAEALAASSYGA